ncbi:MAG: acylphosphatase [Spirochaetia bacterium]
MSAGENKAFHALVLGRVQGVGFRYSALRQANVLGIMGTVANTPEGSVEVNAEGEPLALQRFLLWLEKGPPGCRVRDVQVQWLPPTGSYGGFDIVF